jgi:hypothetical protein
MSSPAQRADKLAFAIHYGDGSVFTHEDGTIFEASPINVQAIAQDGDRGWHVVSHGDMYIWRDDMGFLAVDEPGYWDYMYQTLDHPKIVFFGRTIDTPLFQEIFQSALAFADQMRRAN